MNVCRIYNKHIKCLPKPLHISYISHKLLLHIHNSYINFIYALYTTPTYHPALYRSRADIDNKHICRRLRWTDHVIARCYEFD